MELRFQVHTRIEKPINEVFDAVYNPKKLSGYFTKAASGPLEEGSTVTWNFAEVPGDVLVSVKKVVPDQLLILEWEAGEGSYNTRVEIGFESLDSKSTLIKISESGWKATQRGLNNSYDNCEGWTQMSCCLKAFLEYGINLRKRFYLEKEVLKKLNR